MDNADLAYHLVHEPPMEQFLKRHYPTGNPTLTRLAHYADAAKSAYLVFTVGIDGDEDEEDRIRDRWLRLRQRFIKGLPRG